MRLGRPDEFMAFARAPLRVGLAGGGSDLPSYAERFGGMVVNFAINRFVTVACWIEKNPVEPVANNLQDDSTGLISASESDQKHSQMSIADGTIEWFKSHGHFEVSDLILRHTSQVGPGSGLGGSSAAVVACFSAVALHLGREFNPSEVAQAAITIEREICAIPGGIQDFFPAISGGFRLITSDGLRDFLDEPIRISQSLHSWLSESLFIVPLGDRPRDMNLVVSQNRQMKNKASSIEAGHTVKELASIAVPALSTEDIQTLASVINGSWKAKREFAQGTITQKMEEIREVCLDNGALAVKVAGAGGGGHLVGLVDPQNRPKIAKALSKTGRAFEAIRPIESGVATWTVQETQFGHGEESFRREAQRSFTSLNC
jgi:D-glycero-alpha-D-manno-heptose-7-phosphate kinase